MKIESLGNMGATKVRMLEAASGLEIKATTELKTKRDGRRVWDDVFWVKGERFSTLAKAGHYILEQVNSWMLENGMVKIEELKPDARGYPNWKIAN